MVGMKVVSKNFDFYINFNVKVIENFKLPEG
jgi:hypothetical protein